MLIIKIVTTRVSTILHWAYIKAMVTANTQGVSGDKIVLAMHRKKLKLCGSIQNIIDRIISGNWLKLTDRAFYSTVGPNITVQDLRICYVTFRKVT